LQIINDGKQNKPGVNIRPVGDEASFEAAQVFQEVVRHIEYISGAENVYDNAATFQVNAGWGYWRVTVEKISGTFSIKKFISDVLKTLAQFILILILMKLMVLMLGLVLSLTICQRIYMKLSILNLRMLATCIWK
jgi:hypothetical protein